MPNVAVAARAPKPLTRDAAARLAASFLAREEAAKLALRASLDELAREEERQGADICARRTPTHAFPRPNLMLNRREYAFPIGAERIRTA